MSICSTHRIRHILFHYHCQQQHRKLHFYNSNKWQYISPQRQRHFISSDVSCNLFANFSTTSTETPHQEKGNTTKKEEIELPDVSWITKKVNDELERAKAGKSTELDETYRQYVAQLRKQNEFGAFQKVFTWKFFGIFCTIAGSMLVVLAVLWKIKSDERDIDRKRTYGRARIGGEWELVNMDGKLETSKDLHGKWLLIYFGFTNCPDICPEQIEKMVEVVDILNREVTDLQILPIFMSVDPRRDTVERVKKYYAEFSPKLRGYTGSKEQVNKVAKAFRVYHSEGPDTAEKNDYIVDHTVILYLVDPEGLFHDYYGQNRMAREISEVIKNKAFIWQVKKNKEKSILRRIMKSQQTETAVENN